MIGGNPDRQMQGPDIANEVTDLCHSQTPPQFLCVHSISFITQCPYISMPESQNDSVQWLK